MRREKSDYQIKSVGFALDLLEEFMTKDEALNSAKLVKSLKINRKSAEQLLETLEERRYLSKARHSGHYHLGETAFVLRQTFIKHLDVIKTARPILQRLATDSAETCFLAKPEDNFIVYHKVIESGQTLRVRLNQNSRAELHACGAGKTFLAFADREIRDNLLGRIIPESRPSNVLAKTLLLKRQLNSIFTQGYALEHEEHHQGAGCIVAPVFNHTGNVAVTIGLMIPLTRFNEERLKMELIPQLIRGADDISRGLGFVRNTRKSHMSPTALLRQEGALKSAPPVSTSEEVEYCPLRAITG